MLAHYLSKWSKEFADTLLTGDIHQVNADRVGVSRSEIKRITYCFTYGGGNLKLGKTFNDQLSDEQAKAKGAELREAFVSSIDGLAELLASIKKQAKKATSSLSTADLSRSRVNIKHSTTCSSQGPVL